MQALFFPVVLVIAISYTGGGGAIWELEGALHNHVKPYHCFGFSTCESFLQFLHELSPQR